MSAVPRAYEEADARLKQKRGLVDDVYEHVRTHKVRELDPDQLPRRLKRLLKNPLIQKNVREKGVLDELSAWSLAAPMSRAAESELERIIGGAADFVPTWFLVRGAELRRTVGRLRAKTAAGKDRKATGFLVGPRLFLTNYHALDWSDIGEEGLAAILPYSEVELDYEEQFTGQMERAATFKLEPSVLTLASPWYALDYVLVALSPTSLEGTPLETFGYNRLAGDLGKINKGEPVYVIQHPNGQPKQVVLQHNRLIDRDDASPYLTYEADTDRGSSGSPVFNRQWEVVALHHSVEIARDDQGRVLARDGTIWTQAMGSDQIRYLDLNEGIRISKVLEDLAHKRGQVTRSTLAPLVLPETCSAEGARLLDEALRTHMGAPPAEIMRPTAPPVRARVPSRTTFPRPE